MKPTIGGILEASPSRDGGNLSSKGQAELSKVGQTHGLDVGSVVGPHGQTSDGQVVADVSGVPVSVDLEVGRGHKDPLLGRLGLIEHVVGAQDDSHGSGSVDKKELKRCKGILLLLSYPSMQ